MEYFKDCKRMVCSDFYAVCQALIPGATDLHKILAKEKLYREESGGGSYCILIAVHYGPIWLIICGYWNGGFTATELVHYF